MNIALRAEDVGKRYRIGISGELPTHRKPFTRLITAPLRNLKRLRRLAAFGDADEADILWALRHATFEVEVGEVLGIIGHNGAGKSTLLKILSRITAPSEGEVEIVGRVGSLLEVGTGFHQELTGRENIFLNGSILGMDRAYIAHRFEEIVDFAGVERFVDTPVKRYSSGMYLRLAFAVAAHLEPDILIVDEVLAVGDAAFQKKCIEKMGSVAGEGRTVLFVSHNMDAVQRLCTRCLYFQNGRLLDEGTPGRIISKYLTREAARSAPRSWIDLSHANRLGSGEAHFTKVRYTSHNDDLGGFPSPLGAVDFDLCVHSDAVKPVSSVAVVIYSPTGTKLINADSGIHGHTLVLEEGENLIRLRLSNMSLNPGTYGVGLWLAVSPNATNPLDSIGWAFQMEVLPDSSRRWGWTPQSDGLIPAQFDVQQIARERASELTPS